MKNRTPALSVYLPVERSSGIARVDGLFKLSSLETSKQSHFRSA